MRVLPVAGIFGANASGKSNLLSAFHAMREAIRTSFADWAKYPGVPHRQPFKLDAACAEETTLFEVDLVLGARTPVRNGRSPSSARSSKAWSKTSLAAGPE